MAEAPPVEPEPAGAVAAVPPPVIEQSPPVTSPEVGTDSEAGGKGKFHLLVVDNNFRSNGFPMFFNGFTNFTPLLSTFATLLCF